MKRAKKTCKRGHEVARANALWKRDKRSKKGGRWECRTCNLESARKSTKKWQAANPEKVRAMKRGQIKRWRQRYPEKHHQAQKAYRAANPGYWRNYQAKHRETITAASRKARHARRAKLIKLLGGQCVACGATTRLDIDHRLPRTKLFKLSGRDLLRSWKAVLAESEKCALRCRTCHNKKTWLERAGVRALKVAAAA